VTDVAAGWGAQPLMISWRRMVRRPGRWRRRGRWGI